MWAEFKSPFTYFPLHIPYCIMKLSRLLLIALFILMAADKAIAENHRAGTKAKLRFGVTAVAVESDLSTHKKLVSLIGKRMGVPVETIYRKSYQEMSSLLESNGVDMAFVCGLPYVLDHDKFGLELLVTPVFMDKPQYQSYLIVGAERKAAALADLQGRIFAFSDPLSNSGFLVPVYYLSKMGQTPESFFKSYFFTYSHMNSIEAVASSLADGAFVDSYVWELASRSHPEITSKTKIIYKSDFMPFTPFVVRPGLNKSIKDKLKGILLSLHTDPEGRDVLNSMVIERFEQLKDSDYNSIRNVYKAVSLPKTVPSR